MSLLLLFNHPGWLIGATNIPPGDDYTKRPTRGAVAYSSAPLMTSRPKIRKVVLPAKPKDEQIHTADMLPLIGQEKAVRQRIALLEKTADDLRQEQALRLLLEGQERMLALLEQVKQDIQDLEDEWIIMLLS